jgi:uncharacterized protein related to proFAR isomerase
MKYGIIGSRTFSDYDLLTYVLDKHNISLIVSGGARGADSLGARYADERQIHKIIFSPDWDKYGKRAGFIRNKQIVNESDFIIAFWDLHSVGTRHSLDLAKKLGKLSIVVGFDGHSFNY